MHMTAVEVLMELSVVVVEVRRVRAKEEVVGLWRRSVVVTAAVALEARRRVSGWIFAANQVEIVN